MAGFWVQDSRVVQSVNFFENYLSFNSGSHIPNAPVPAFVEDTYLAIDSGRPHGVGRRLWSVNSQPLLYSCCIVGEHLNSWKECFYGERWKE